jgi:cytochrome c oxidase subunit IV
MDLTVATYLLYLAVTIPLTLWVARALHRHGQIFLNDVFSGDTNLARAVNQLLVIGFYLLNLGYVALFMTSQAQVDSVRRLMEVLSAKVGAVAIVVGAVHLANVWMFNAFRRRALLRAKSLPPLEPNGFTPVMAAAAQGAAHASWAPPGAGLPWSGPWGGTPAAGQEK